ncbi:MAG TPA: hypothetical protein VLM05_08355 [Mycobacteriales bacterium]|nr:hypothetical protein [Mycobacteriales bacterium]
MREYLVRTVAGRDWPAIPRPRLAETLITAGFECEPVAGSNHLRLRCGDAYITFSIEATGWQISVDGHLDDPDVFVGRITEQVSDAVGQPCEWLPVPADQASP